MLTNLTDQAPNRFEVIMRKTVVHKMVAHLVLCALCLWVAVLMGADGTVSAADYRNDMSASESETAVRPLFNEPGALQYRLVYFPHSRIAEILPMPGRYPPISAELFQHRMQLLQRSGRQNGQLDNSRIMKSLDLAARLDGKQLVLGKGIMRVGSFDVAHQTEAANPVALANESENPSIRDTAEAAKNNVTAWPIVLSPFRLAISEPYWNDDTPGHLGLVAGDKTVLYAPPENGELRFNWTLQGATDSRNDLFFLFELPQFLQIRLFLDLPNDKKPITSVGIVRLISDAEQKDGLQSPCLSEDIPEGHRRWQIAFNSNQQQRVVIAPDEGQAKYHGTIAVSEHHSYDLSLYGVQFISQFFIEKSEFVFTELLVELDEPLSPLSVKSGDRLLAWTEVPTEDPNVTRLLVSFPSTESGMRRLQVQAFCPTQIDHLWELPKVRILSPLFFWNETRNIVRVNRPLQTRRLVTPELRQETPVSSVDETESDLFVFQSFSEKSTIGVELGIMQPRLLVQSGTVFQWGERELIARAVLDISVDEGQVSQLDFDVDANWTVDLIEATDSTRVGNYFVDETDGEPSATARWAVTLRRAIDASQPVRLIVQLRRPLSSEEQAANNDPTKNNRYPLSDFMPIRILNSRQGTQLIAFATERRYRMIVPHGKEGAPAVSREQTRERFDEVPFSTVLACTPQQEDAVLEIEAVKPTHGVTAITRLIFQNGLLTETCRFHCVPAENSRLNQLTVHFSRHNQSENSAGWTWGLGDETESSQQIKAAKYEPPQNGDSNIGEIWELDLTPARSSPFDITATRVIPFDGKVMVALPFFPDISNVDACLILETGDATLYRITQNPTRAVSDGLLSTLQTGSQTNATGTDSRNIPSAEINRHAIRGIYRYEANDRTLLSKNAAFMIEPVRLGAGTIPNNQYASDQHANTVSDTVLGKDTTSNGYVHLKSHNNTGNIWQMALHSHVYPNGKVVSYAIMMLENRTMDQLKVAFPPNMTSDNIRNVWVENTKVVWDAKPREKGGFDLVLTIPVQQRFLNIMVEYVCDQESDTLSPHMPILDIPVFSQKWYVWHSPEFQGVFDSSQQERTRLLNRGEIRLSDSPESARWPGRFKRNVSGFDVFMSPLWWDGRLSAGTENQLVTCSQQVTDLLADEVSLKKLVRRNRQNGTTENPAPEAVGLGNELGVDSLCWGDLLASDAFQAAVSGNWETQEGATPQTGHRKILIDRVSLTRSEIVSDSLVFAKERANGYNVAKNRSTSTAIGEHGLALLERNSLALIFDGHDNVLVTTVLTAAKLRQQLTPIYSDFFWYAPSGNFTAWDTSSNTLAPDSFVSPLVWREQSAPTRKEQWFSDLSSHTLAYRPGWVVQETTYSNESPVSIRLVRNSTVLHFQLCAFFAVLLLFWRCPLKYLSGLIVILILAMTLADHLPLLWVPVAYGLFWGGICAAAFGLIRYFHVDREQQTHAVVSDDETTIATIYQGSDDSELGEVRDMFVSSRDAAKNVESLSDTQLDTDSDDVPPPTSPEGKKADESSHDKKKQWHANLLWLVVALTVGMTLVMSGFVAAQPPGLTEPSPSTFPATEQQMPFSEAVRNILESQSLSAPYQVFIPYDKDGRPENRYYVPERLYLLLQQADQNTSASGNWQIRSARYTGTLAMQSKLTPFNLRAVYEIELHDQSAKVRLPEMPLLPDTVRCDNQLIQPTIEQVGQGAAARNEYVFALSGQGRHTLEFSILPGVYDTPESQLRHFNFPIPRVPDSTFVLTLPHANLPVEVSPTLGQVTRIGDQWKAELGPIDRLSLSWPIQSSSQQNCGVSQYFRFRINDKRVRLQTRYLFKVSSGSIRHVLLNIDPRYQRDGDYRVSAEVEAIDSIPGSTSQVRITLRNPVTDNLIVEADYIPQNLSGSGDFSGTGTLALPQFSATDVRIERSWLGVSSDTSTTIELPLSNVETKMFENAWGSPGLPVHFAFDLLRPMENHWFLSVRSRPLLNRINQRQWVLFRDRSVFMFAEADVTPGYEVGSFESTEQLTPVESIPVFHHEMFLPEGFQLESVELKGTNSEVYPTPRVEQNGRQATLFFRKPILGKYTVSVSGTLPVKSNDKIDFPMFDHADQSTLTRSVYCYRDSSALVDLTLADNSVLPVETLLHPLPMFAESHHISSFRVESPSEFSGSTIAIRPNKPKISGNMVSRLESNLYPNERWGMTVMWDISISEGELNRISIFLPVLSNEVSIFSNTPLRLTQKPSGNGTMLQLNPHEPLTGNLYFWIRFPIGGMLDVVSVPNAVFQNENTINHYVSLPTHAAYQPLNWTLSNLTPTDLTLDKLITHRPTNDPISSLPSLTSAAQKYYSVSGPDFSARTNYVQGDAFVSCHDLTCFVKRDGFYLAMSKFDIYAGGSHYCDIRIPESLQIIQMRINGISPMPQQLDEQTLRVELLSDVPLQQLTILYCSSQNDMTRRNESSRATLSESGKLQTHLKFPQILSFPVQKTLWELYMDKSPAMADRLDIDLQLWDKQEFFDVNYPAMVALPREKAANLQARMGMARLNQLLLHFRMMSSQTSGNSASFDWKPAWYDKWAEVQTRTLDYIAITEKEKNAEVAEKAEETKKTEQAWRQSFGLKTLEEFQKIKGETPLSPEEWNAVMAFAELCFSRESSPRTVYEEIVAQQQASSKEDTNASTAKKSEMEPDREYFMRRFWNNREQVHVLAGVVPYGLTGQTLTMHEKEENFFNSETFNYLIWGSVFAVMLVLAVTKRSRQILKRFSILFVLLMMVFCWLFLEPNLLGWLVLVVLLFSAIRIQWNQMRIATEAVRHDHSTVSPRSP